MHSLRAAPHIFSSAPLAAIRPLAALLLMVGGTGLSVGCTGGGATSKYSFTALEPGVELVPTAIDFGGVVVPYAATETFVILNTGRSDLNVEDVYLNSDEGGVFSVEFETTVVPPDEKIEIPVTFKPKTYEDYTGSIAILTDDPETPVTYIPVSGSGIDGPIPELAIEPGALDFGVVDVGSAGQQIVRLVNYGAGDVTIDSMTIDGSGKFSIVGASSIEGSTIGGEDETSLIFEYRPTATSGDNATVTFHTNDPVKPEQTLFLLGNGGGDFQYPDAEIDCPDRVNPPIAVGLDGRGSTDPMNPSGELKYEWTVLSTPDGSSTTDVIDPGKDYTNLFVDLAGSWTVQLVVENEVGLRSEPDVCQFDAIPPKNVHVELIWDTGNSDLDLHLVQGDSTPFSLPGDCNYCNPSPDWGNSGGADDPLLALDNRTGYGPENINMDSPYNGDYVVYVHYFDDKGGGDSVATVRVWINGAMEWEGSALLTKRDMWRVGYIRWPDASFQDFGESPDRWTEGTACR